VRRAPASSTGDDVTVSVVEKLGAINGLYVLDTLGKGLDFTGRPTNWTKYGSFQAGAVSTDVLLIETSDTLLIEGTDELLLGA